MATRNKMIQKSLIIQSLSTPDRLGYNDKISIVRDDESMAFHCPCSACPNPYRPSDGALWRDAYGWIACNTKETPYPWQCVESPKHGKCLLLNGGGELPARFPNSNHGGRAVVSEVEIHCGSTEQWRGSAACITLPPFIWLAFIGYFQLNETGNLYVYDGSNMEKTI